MLKALGRRSLVLHCRYYEGMYRSVPNPSIQGHILDMHAFRIIDQLCRSQFVKSP